MPVKKKGGKKKKLAKAVDWGAMPHERFVYIEVRNSAWASMRFTVEVSSLQPLETVRQIIIDRHAAVSSQGLRLFLGEECTPENEFKAEDYSLPLEELNIQGGSKNDHFEQVITYEHTPFSKSILNIPRGLPMLPMTVGPN
mmetsp:Transcript_26742/g.58715  ORF Transcript_26742/g.58715 Transcript_26742/m.58715 type:complete len:141 (-) Transcript_26742:341-763(-)